MDRSTKLSFAQVRCAVFSRTGFPPICTPMRLGVNLASHSHSHSHSHSQRWADQEALIVPRDGSQAETLQLLPHGEIRASFRFLHGSLTELLYSAQHWHTAHVGAMFTDGGDAIDATAAGGNNSSNNIAATTTTATPPVNPRSTVDAEHGNRSSVDPRVFTSETVRPSDFALKVTREQLELDYATDNPVLAHRLEHYKHMHPDVVVITEGWGGVPGCSSHDIQSLRHVVAKQPEVRFVWAPLFVTNHQQARYDCFAPAFSSSPLPPSTSSGSATLTDNNRSSLPNLIMVDLWNVTAKLLLEADQQRASADGGDGGIQRPGSSATHIRVGVQPYVALADHSVSDSAA